MDYLILVLRLVHILSGMFWIGSSILLGFFIVPAVRATSTIGQKFMAHLDTSTRLPIAITISAILTVTAGGWLYWIDSEGLTSAWKNSGPGWGFGTGGLFALIGFVFGALAGRSAYTQGKLVVQVQGEPTAEQVNLIEAAQKQYRVVRFISNIALIIALACMATARYWRF